MKDNYDLSYNCISNPWKHIIEDPIHNYISKPKLFNNQSIDVIPGRWVNGIAIDPYRDVITTPGRWVNSIEPYRDAVMDVLYATFNKLQPLSGWNHRSIEARIRYLEKQINKSFEKCTSIIELPRLLFYCYDHNEDVRNVGQYVNINQIIDGKRQGRWLTYRNGQLIQDAEYVDDLIEGRVQSFTNGQLISDQVFHNNLVIRVRDYDWSGLKIVDTNQKPKSYWDRSRRLNRIRIDSKLNYIFP